MDAEVRVNITERLLASGRYLDQGDFEAYLSLFDDDGEYLIVADVPEIAGHATWMDLTKAELQGLLESASRHMWNSGVRTHHIAAPCFTRTDNAIETVAAVSVFRTCSKGSTTVYAVGQYHDWWVLQGEAWLLKRRRLQLATRDLTPPSALPL